NPEQLMSSPVEGTMRLVGVAYAFRSAPDARLPAAFDGALDRWHDHPRFAPAGETLHMLHVWFVESPDGPFAGFNPWLPFFAVGVTPPDAERMVDPVADARIRSLAAALGTIAEPTLLGRAAERFADAETVRAIEASRDSIRSFVRRLADARNEGDWVAWDRRGRRESAGRSGLALRADAWRAERTQRDVRGLASGSSCCTSAGVARTQSGLCASGGGGRPCLSCKGRGVCPSCNPARRRMRFGTGDATPRCRQCAFAPRTKPDSVV
ncbi:MAG: hypothetical protein ACREM1_00140, partial [Longimicrobiales bacterium]